MEILIGGACGFFMGTMFINAAALRILLPNGGPSIAATFLLRGTSSFSASVLLPLMVMAAWGVIGSVVGLLYIASEEVFPENGLGSPNRVFTIGVLIFTVNALMLSLLLVRRMNWWEGYGLALAFLGIFGWLMPWLAD